MLKNICQFLYLLTEKRIVQTMFLLDLLEIWKQSLENYKYVGIAKPIVYQFTKSFCATLNAREVSFKKCCATNNVRDIFPNKIAQSSAGLT